MTVSHTSIYFINVKFNFIWSNLYIIFYIISTSYCGETLFQFELNEKTRTLTLDGNFDASRTEEVKAVLDHIEDSLIIDMNNLQFICSSGIGIMVMTYRKLKEKGKEVYLINLNDHIRKVFEVAMLNKIFNIK